MVENIGYKPASYVFHLFGHYPFQFLDGSEKEIDVSFFFTNSKPKEPGPQLLAMAEEAF